MGSARIIGPVATISDNCQITLPEKVMTTLDMHPGDGVEFFPLSPGRYMIYVSGRRLSMKGVFPKAERTVSIKQMNRVASGKKGKKK